MYVGIVGHERLKFNDKTMDKAFEMIEKILSKRGTELVSGACHLGGIDKWAEEVAKRMLIPYHIFPPKTQSWSTGYKPRNIQIATLSDIVHVIVVSEYPAEYRGMVFDRCYHCNTSKHIKSGGCWTAHYAAKLGKKTKWHVI